MLGPFLETLIGGLLTGVLYSLVALGFVLIFKASGVFNFAQGAMVLFAALTLARLTGEIDGREVHLANFVVAAAILGTALAFIAWYAWREFVARGGGPAEGRRMAILAAVGARDRRRRRLVPTARAHGRSGSPCRPRRRSWACWPMPSSGWCCATW